jgi:hypothetical protein
LAAIVREDRSNGGKATQIDIALATPNGTRKRSYSWGTERADSHVWVSTHALAQLWQYLIDPANRRQA